MIDEEEEGPEYATSAIHHQILDGLRDVALAASRGDLDAIQADAMRHVVRIWREFGRDGTLLALGLALSNGGAMANELAVRGGVSIESVIAERRERLVFDGLDDLGDDDV